MHVCIYIYARVHTRLCERVGILYMYACGYSYACVSACASTLRVYLHVCTCVRYRGYKNVHVVMCFRFHARTIRVYLNASLFTVNTIT